MADESVLVLEGGTFVILALNMNILSDLSTEADRLVSILQG